MRFLKYLLWIRSWVRILQVISSSASNYTTNGLLPRGQRERENMHARRNECKSKSEKERCPRSHIHFPINIYELSSGTFGSLDTVMNGIDTW